MGGDYVFVDENLSKFSRKEDLFGISTYVHNDDVKFYDDVFKDKSFYDKFVFVRDNVNQWNEIDVWDEAIKYFDWDNTRSVKYSGYLINHDKKQAIDLADYHEKSKYSNEDGSYILAIDLLPVLTETGDGSLMALYDVISADTTEELIGAWCGDFLQIIDEIPPDYKIVKCCFAEAKNRSKYCYKKFGFNEDGYLLNDGSGKLFEAAMLNICGQRGPSRYIKEEKIENGIRFNLVSKKA